MAVYLIHFSKKYHHCRHYIGFAETDVQQRFRTHKQGRGAKLLKAVVEAGINIRLVRVWEDGDRNFERKLKNYKKASHFCPVCNKNCKV